jgi:hypothetical protein
MEVSIRKATAEDYPALCKLFDEVDALHRGNLPHIFQKPNGPVREHDYYLGLIADESVGLFVAQVGGELVGFVHSVIRDAPTIMSSTRLRLPFTKGLAMRPLVEE